MATAIETYVVSSNGKATIGKDPAAVLDYTFVWDAYLAPIADTIQSVQFLLDPPLVLERQAFDLTRATAWISGGAVPVSPAPNSFRVTCRITTTGGRVDDRSIFLKIVER